MGPCQSTTEIVDVPPSNSNKLEKESPLVLPPPPPPPPPRKITTEDLANYKLRKRRPGCSGMFWRSDPTGRTQLLANSDWPRDGAIIQGEAFVGDGGDEMKTTNHTNQQDERWWLKAHKVKQVGQKWVNAPEGAFLPFEHDNHYYLERVFG